MSNRKNPYLFYTEYYIISGAYQFINVVNGILTYSASYSDNIKEYLRNQVASKQVALNELIRNEHDARVNAKQNESDVDEDGFVIIKMRKQKIKNKCDVITSNSTYMLNENTCENGNVNVKKEEDHDRIIKEFIERLINDVVNNDVVNNNFN